MLRIVRNGLPQSCGSNRALIDGYKLVHIDNFCSQMVLQVDDSSAFGTPGADEREKNLEVPPVAAKSKHEKTKTETRERETQREKHDQARKGLDCFQAD